jgi:ATP:ADP antiporter, AAA family
MPTEQGAASRGLGRLLTRLAPIEPKEVPIVVAAFCLFFCVFAGYFAVRPVRETMGTILGKARVADLFLVTWAASLLIIPIYGVLVAKFRRSLFLPWIYGSIAVALAVVGLVLRTDEKSVFTAQFFYVFISVLNLFIVSVFWSFLLELFTSNQSKRLFGIIAAGGTAGALVGPAITDLLVKQIGNSGVLFLGAFMFLLTIFFQRALLAIWKREEAEFAATQASAQADGGSGGRVRGDRPIGGNPFAGFVKVFTSPYLLAIALFVFLLASVNTFLYFEQLRLVEQLFSDPSERTRIFARLDWIVQSLTVICQVFLTGRIASRLGLTTLLIIVPLAMIFGFFALAATGTFMVLAIVFVTRRVGEYAFVRPAREMLFSRLDNETKYKAKNVIDVPVYRGADAFTAQMQKWIEHAGLTPANAAMIGAGVAAAWAVNAWFLGRKNDAETASLGAKAAALEARGH